MKPLIYVLIVMFSVPICAQEILKGQVVTNTIKTKNSPMHGVSVYWAGTTIGTVTNTNGMFSIPYDSANQQLVISYVGFKSDTLTITGLRPIQHVLVESQELDEVMVNSKKKKSSVSYLKTANILQINEDELLKAACCNLSESFATNPSIDVNFSDALTGTKQIKLLGLTSPYILITQENIPNVRGASQAYGLTFTPGTWIESIQITKGAGSVINGFESIVGQINTEIKKPSSSEKFFLNAYGSLMGRMELNTHFNQKVTDKWATSLFLHGNLQRTKHDTNDDGFLDMPLYDQVNILNRWQYTDAVNGFVSFINFRYLADNKQLGEYDFDPNQHKLGNQVWGAEIATKRFDASAKMGYVFPETPYQSMTAQFAYSHHNQDSYFGLRRYDIEHESVYATASFNSIIGSTLSKFKSGLSYTYDNYLEEVAVQNFDRQEHSVGAFFEYIYDNIGDFSLTAGMRLDVHNLLGTFATPRLHIRYAPWSSGVLRASVGRGKRSANIFAENQRLFGSSRQFDVLNNSGKIYGLNPEIAWNYGFSFMQGFNLLGRKGDVTADYYSTRFSNKVLIDLDEDPQRVVVYNSEDGAYANNLQLQVNYELSNTIDLRVAYKHYDVKSTFLRGEMMDPLLAEHRFFANLGYESPANAKGGLWRFDVTYNWVGEQRLPFTGSNPAANQLPTNSPSYSIFDSQLTRVFSPKFEVYIGGENIGAYQQENAILANDDPFGPYFDSTIIYAPVFGATYYAGLRFKI